MRPGSSMRAQWCVLRVKSTRSSRALNWSTARPHGLSAQLHAGKVKRHCPCDVEVRAVSQGLFDVGKRDGCLKSVLACGMH